MTKKLTDDARDNTRAKRLGPVNVASLLRTLQASAHRARRVSIALDVDEALHVAAEAEQFLDEIGQLLDESIASSSSGAHIVLRCSSEPHGVVVEIERTAPPTSGGADSAVAVAVTLPGVSVPHTPRTWTSSSTTAIRSTSA